MRQLEGEIHKVVLTIFLDGSGGDIDCSNEGVHREGPQRVGVVSGTRYNAFLKVKNLRKVVNDGKGCGSVNPQTAFQTGYESDRTTTDRVHHGRAPTHGRPKGVHCKVEEIHGHPMSHDKCDKTI